MSERLEREAGGLRVLIQAPIYPDKKDPLRLFFGQPQPPRHNELLRQSGREGFPWQRAFLRRDYLPASLDWCHKKETGAQPAACIRLRIIPNDGLECF